MNVANFTANVSYGLADRLDIFGAWDFIQRVDRDNLQLFNTDPDRGGVDPRAPYANERWTGNKIGDLRVGTKYAFLSEEAGNPFGLAARFMLNLPTGDADEGAGQGGVAADVSGVLSKWLTSKVVLSGELGYNFRKNPEEPVVVHVPNFLRWGAGLGITPNDNWLIHGELLGRTWQRDNTSLDGRIVAEDGTLSPHGDRDRSHDVVHDRRHLVCEQRLLRRRRAALGYADARIASTPRKIPTATSSTITSASAGARAASRRRRRRRSSRRRRRCSAARRTS